MSDQTAENADGIRIEPERMRHIGSMVKKKANAALSARPGMHFRVYPPPEYLADPAVLNEPGVYARLKDTVWWVRWYDDQYDPLSFIEFLAFVDQIGAAERAFRKATAGVSAIAGHRASKHGGGWQPKKDRSRKPEPVRVRVEGRLVVADLVADVRVRALFNVVDLETVARPNDALN